MLSCIEQHINAASLTKCIDEMDMVRVGVVHRDVIARMNLAAS